MPSANPKRAWRARALLVLLGLGSPATGLGACARTEGGHVPSPAGSGAGGSGPRDGGADVPVPDTGPTTGDAGRDADAGAPPWIPATASAIDGPHEDLGLDAGRPIYYAFPRAVPRPLRLVGHLHGMCGPPSYACGRWIGAGTEVGAMVCPTGNARCGDSPFGPPSWEAPSWLELVGIMDRDLESAVAKVERKHRGAIQRDGAVLTGYSRGAYAAPVIASAHPGRWPYLVLIEAKVPLTVQGLRAAGVRAVALVAGEQGTEIAAMRKTLAELERAEYPARLFVMPRTGHLYSEDMEQVMHEALSFVLSVSK